MSDAADSNAETLSAILNVSQAEAAALLQQTGGDINVRVAATATAVVRPSEPLETAAARAAVASG